jgi:hypothetical protein
MKQASSMPTQRQPAFCSVPEFRPPGWSDKERDKGLDIGIGFQFLAGNPFLQDAAEVCPPGMHHGPGAFPQNGMRIVSLNSRIKESSRRNFPPNFSYILRGLLHFARLTI